MYELVQRLIWIQSPASNFVPTCTSVVFLCEWHSQWAVSGHRHRKICTQRLSGHVLQIEGPMQVARRSDVDMNGHINNVTYIAWALETVPRDVYYNYELQQVPC